MLYNIRGKFVLGTVTIVVTGIVYLVHYQQLRDRKEMHKGVQKDIERIKLKKQQSLSEVNK